MPHRFDSENITIPILEVIKLSLKIMGTAEENSLFAGSTPSLRTCPELALHTCCVATF